MIIALRIHYRDTLLFSCPRQAIVMSRIAGVVVSAIAQHVTQRGNRCWRVFFVMRIMSSILTSLPPPRRQVWHRSMGLERCMPNHVHVMAVPSEPGGLARTFADAHRRKT